MKIITEIEVLSRSRSRITIDDELRFILPPQAVSAFNLTEGLEIPDTLYQVIYDEYILRPAKLKALQLLERRDYTKWELENRLLQAGFPPEAAEAALHYAQSYHYVDDERYVQSYLSWKASGKSRQSVYQTLRAKGVDDDTLRSCMEEWDTDETESIRNILEKKFGDSVNFPKEKKQKVLNYFLRRGYKYNDIIDVLKEFDSV